MSSTAYHESVLYVTKDAIIIEISPHTLLQAILNRSLGPECLCISLTKHSKNLQGNISVLLSAIEKTYDTEIQPQITKLVSSYIISSSCMWDTNDSIIGRIGSFY